MKATRTTTVPARTNLIGSRPLFSSMLLQLLIICSVITLTISCKKDKDDPAPPAEKELQVHFSASSIAYNLVDSGFVVLKKEGATTQIFKRFEKNADTLSFSIDDLSAGNWTAEMYIFARFNASAGRRYRQDKTFTVQAGGVKESIILAAPTGVITDSWKSYAFFRHEGQGVSVAIPLDNADPHFDIEVRETKWNFYYIERYASNRLPGGANAKVAEYIWSCTQCYTSQKFISNDDAFIPFTQEVGNKQWNNGLIIIVLNDGQGGAIQFSHQYNK